MEKESIERNNKAKHGRKVLEKYLKTKEKVNGLTESQVKTVERSPEPSCSSDTVLGKTKSLMIHDEGGGDNLSNAKQNKSNLIRMDGNETSTAMDISSKEVPSVKNIDEFSCEELMLGEIRDIDLVDPSQKYVREEIFLSKIKEFQNAIEERDDNINKLTVALQTVIKHKELLEKNLQVQTDSVLQEFYALKKQVLGNQGNKKFHGIPSDKVKQGGSMEVKICELENKLLGCGNIDGSDLVGSTKPVVSSIMKNVQGTSIPVLRYLPEHEDPCVVPRELTSVACVLDQHCKDVLPHYCVVHGDALLKLSQFVSKSLACQHKYVKNCRARVNSILNMDQGIQKSCNNGGGEVAEFPEIVSQDPCDSSFDETQEYFEDFSLTESELLSSLEHIKEENALRAFEVTLDTKLTRITEHFQSEERQLQEKMQLLLKMVSEKDEEISKLSQSSSDRAEGDKTVATTCAVKLSSEEEIIKLRDLLQDATARSVQLEKENGVLRTHIETLDRTIIEFEERWRNRQHISADHSSVSSPSQPFPSIIHKPSEIENTALSDVEKGFMKDLQISSLCAKLKVLCTNQEVSKLDIHGGTKTHEFCDNKRKFLSDCIALLQDECKHLHSRNLKLIGELASSRKDVSNLNLLVETNRKTPNPIPRPILEIRDSCTNCAVLTQTCEELRTKLQDFQLKWDYPNKKDIDSFFEAFSRLNDGLNEVTKFADSIPNKSGHQNGSDEILSSLQTDLRSLHDRLVMRELEVSKLHEKLDGKCQIYHVQEQSIQSLQNQIQKGKVKIQTLENVTLSLEAIIKDREEEKEILHQELINLKHYIQDREGDLLLQISTLESEKKVAELCLTHSQVQLANLQMKQKVEETKNCFGEQSRIAEVKELCNVNALKEISLLKLEMEAKYSAYIASIQKSLTNMMEGKLEGLLHDSSRQTAQENVESSAQKCCDGCQVRFLPEHFMDNVKKELIQTHKEELEAVNNKWHREILYLRKQWESELRESRNWSDLSIDEAIERVIKRISEEWKTLVKKLSHGLSSEMMVQLQKMEDDWYNECKLERKLLQENIISLGKAGGQKRHNINFDKAAGMLGERQKLTAQLSDLQKEVSDVINSVISSVRANLETLFCGVNTMIENCESNVKQNWNLSQQELESKHKKDMEELREYFENKVQQLERNFSLETLHSKTNEGTNSADETVENELIMNNFQTYSYRRNEVNNALLNLLADLGQFFSLWESFGFSLVDNDNTPRKSDKGVTEDRLSHENGNNVSNPCSPPSSVQSVEELLAPSNEDILNETRESLSHIMEYISTGSASSRLDGHIKKLQSLVQNATRQLEVSLPLASPGSGHSDSFRQRNFESLIRSNISTYSNSPRSVGKDSPRKENVVQFYSNEIDSLHKFFTKVKTLLTSPPMDSLQREEIQTKVQEVDASVTDMVCLFIKYIEDKRRETEDLQQQIEAADQQLKSTRKFMEEQASERELEREEYTNELSKLKDCILQKDRERSLEAGLHKEVEILDSQLQEKTQANNVLQEKNNELELQLHATVDKIVDLRTIIKDLDDKLGEKTRSEKVLKSDLDKMKESLREQLAREEELTLELCQLTGRNVKTDLRQHIQYLEEQLGSQAQQLESYHQSQRLLQEMRSKIVQFEAKFDCKTRDFESMIQPFLASTASSPSTEDLSFRNHLAASRANLGSSESIDILPLSGEDFTRFEEKFETLSRVGDAAIGKIRDLESEIKCVRRKLEEVGAERDVLQKQVTQQLLQVTEMKSHMEQQRHQIDPSELQQRLTYLTSELAHRSDVIEAKTKALELAKHESDELRRVLSLRQSEAHKLKRQDSGDARSLDAEHDDVSGDIRVLKKLLDDKNLELERLRVNLMEREGEAQVKSMPTHFAMESYLTSPLSARPQSVSQMVESTVSEIESLREADMERSVQSPAELAGPRGPFKSPSKQQHRLVGSAHSSPAGEDLISSEKLYMRIDMLLLDIERLEDQNRELLDQLVERDGKVEEYKVKLQEKDNNVSKMCKEVEDTRVRTEQQIAAMMDQHRAQNEDNDKLIADLKAALAEIKETIKLKDDQLRRFEENLKEKAAGAHKACLEADTIRQDYADANHKFAIQIKEIEGAKHQLESSLAVLDKANQDLRSEREEWAREKEDLRLQLANLQVKCQNVMLEQQMNEKRVSKSAEEKWAGQLSAMRGELESKCTELVTENNKLKLELQSAKQQLVEKQTLLRTSEDSSSERDDPSEGDVSAAKLDRLINRVHKDGLKVLTLSELLYMQKHSGETSVLPEGWAEEKKTLVNTIKKLELTLDNLEYEQAGKLGVLDYRIEQERTISEDLRSALELEKRHVLDYMGQLSQQRLKTSELEQQCTSLSGDLQSVQLQLQKERRSLDVANQNVLSEKSRNQNLEVALKQAHAEIKKLTFEVEHERKQAQSRAHTVKELKTRLQEEQRNVMTVRNSIELLKSSPLDVRDAAGPPGPLGALQKALEDESVKVRAAQEELQRERTKRDAIVETLSQERSKLAQELASEQKRAQELKQREQDASKEKQLYKLDIDRLQDQVASLTEDNRKLKQDLLTVRRAQEEVQQQWELEKRQESSERLRLVKDNQDRKTNLRTIRLELERVKDEKEMIAKELEIVRESRTELARRLACTSPPISESGQMRELHNLQLLLEKQFAEKSGLSQQVSRLTEDKLICDRKLLLLEKDLQECRARLTLASEHGAKHESASSERSWAVAKLPSERNRAFSEELTLGDDVNGSLDEEQRVQYLYGKYLRAESYRKALIWQKKYLLLLLGGYQETEKITLRRLAQIGSYELSISASTFTPLRRFRSVSQTVLAVFRMKYLVRRWRSGKRVGASAMCYYANRNVVVTSPTHYGGTGPCDRHSQGSAYMLPFSSPRQHPSTDGGLSGRSSVCSCVSGPRSQGFSPPTRDTSSHRSSGRFRRRDLRDLELAEDPNMSDSLSEYIKRFELIQNRLANTCR